MEELLKRHIQETDRRFNALDEDLETLLQKLNNLGELKIQMLFSVKVVSVVVGSISGFFGSVLGGILIYFVTHKF